jgi:hypothetical protein
VLEGSTECIRPVPLKFYVYFDLLFWMRSNWRDQAARMLLDAIPNIRRYNITIWYEQFGRETEQILLDQID